MVAYAEKVYGNSVTVCEGGGVKDDAGVLSINGHSFASIKNDDSRKSVTVKANIKIVKEE